MNAAREAGKAFAAFVAVAWAWLAAVVSVHDVLAGVGVVCLFTGLWWCSPAAAMVVVGVLFLAAGVVPRLPRRGGR